MTKLNMNPDFEGEDAPTGGGGATAVQGNQRKVEVDEELIDDLEGDEEEKEAADEESEEEDDQSDASTDKESGDDSSDGDEEDADADATAQKERELEGLNKEEDKLDKNLSEIDEDIKATKKRIVEKRQARRDARTDSKEEGDVPDKDQEGDDLSDIADEDVTKMERVLKAKGYAPKAELQRDDLKKSQTAVEDSFYEANPQYKVDNDADDTLYNALQAEVKLFARPTSEAQMKQILKRAHAQVVIQFPSRFPTKTKRSATADTAGNRAKMNLAGTGTRNAGPSGSKKADVYGQTFNKGGQGGALTDVQKEHYRNNGWSEEEISEMDGS